METNTETLSTTAEQIVDASLVAPHSRPTVTLKNNDGSIVIYVGNSGVDSTDGYPLAAGEVLTTEIGPHDDIWAVAASGTPTISVIVTHPATTVSND